MQLYSRQGVPLRVGSQVMMYGDVVTIRAMYKPAYPCSHGHVVVRFADGSDGDYSADLIDAHWNN